MIRILLLACSMVACSMVAGEAPGPAPVAADVAVAVVDGREISLRRLEDELLRREGSDAISDVLDELLPRVVWSKLAVADAILILPDLRVDRAGALARVRPHLGEVSDELTAVHVVEGALRAAGIVVGADEIAAAAADAERKLQRQLAARGMPHVDLQSVIKQTKGMTWSQYTEQPAFRVLVVGLRALARRRAEAEVDEAAIADWHRRNLERWRVREAADCSIIHIPYTREHDAAGAEIVTDDERARLRGVMLDLHRAIAGGRLDFVRVFKAFARGHDADAADDGRIGWVARDGTRAQPQARLVPKPVIEAIFAARGPYPQLLPATEHAEGVDIALVHGWRPQADPPFAAIRDQVRADLIEQGLDGRSQRLLAELKAAAKPTQTPDGGVLIGQELISARAIEDATLARHAPAALGEAATEALAAVDWSSLGDDTVVLGAGTWSLSRLALAGRLLRENGARVREELIVLALVEGAIARGEVVVDQAAQIEELARLRRAYAHQPEAAQSDFAGYIRAVYGQEVERFTAEPAFRLLAALGALVRRAAEVDDQALKDLLAADPTIYREPEAVDLAIAYVAWTGAEVAARQRVAVNAAELHQALKSGTIELSQIWREGGRACDPESIDARVGWVDRTGLRALPGAHRVPGEVVAAAFAAKPPWPALL
nr:hypothetical protein [Planctomycetota bacterium]